MLDAWNGALASSRTTDGVEFEQVALVDVPIGSYSGIAAAAGQLVVSGGTSELSLFHYDRETCELSAVTEIGSPPLFRNQPDVAITTDGRFAIIPTNFEGRGFVDYFLMFFKKKKK